MKNRIVCFFLLIQWTFAFLQERCSIQLDFFKSQNESLIDSFIQELESVNINSVNDKAYIPEFIFIDLRRIIGKKFTLANPDEPFNDSCFFVDSLPDRQIEYLGIANNFLLMTYTTGGAGLSSHILLIKYDSNKCIEKLWKGFSGVYLRDLNLLMSYLKESRKHEIDLRYYDDW